MDAVDQLEAAVGVRVLEGLKLWLGTERTDRSDRTGYRFATAVGDGITLHDRRFVTGAMTDLAEVALELALSAALAEADARHGPPLDEAGQRVEFWIVGMGKLGARELNVSSDIDLIYVYEDEGEGRLTAAGDVPPGARAVSFHEYFSFVAKRLYALVGDVTDEGFVFRVDLALRPNGNSGPPVVSLAMLEEYFQVQGREWERFAWLKSRVVAPRAAVAGG
ncbi:MAG: hypothetical protein HUU33_16070, partial [Flavobacteriales bacterium]|nr:hypothetical protein [Flavobacteriales bacterium]